MSSTRKNTMTAEALTITPDAAGQMLALSSENRRVNERRATTMARAILNGEWRLNGDTIKFDKNGRLIDGQVRLRACALANMPIQTIIVRGIDADDQWTIDDNHRRNLGDVLDGLGYEHARMLATATRGACICERQGLDKAIALSFTPTRGELINFAKANVEKLVGIMFGARDFNTRSNGLMTPAIASTIWWSLAKLNNEDAQRFFDLLAVESTDQTLQTLRTRLTHIRDNGPRATRETRLKIAALTVLAWNKWRDGSPARRLDWQSGERFPQAH